MKKRTIFYALSILFLITSCATDRVASGGFLQKRKYNKGFFIRSPFKKLDKTASEEVFFAENQTEIKSETKLIVPTKTKEVQDNHVIDDQTEQEKLELAKNEKTKIKSKTKTVFSNLVKGETVRKSQAKSNRTKLNSITIPNPYVDDDYSQVVALILVLLVGVVGVHRFYLGYIGIGILQIITLGGCGIWTLIDLIRIITGSLQPKYGEYSETL